MKRTAETRRRISEALKGKAKSEEHRKNLSVSHKGIMAGEKNPMCGKHHSEESRKKNSDSHKGIPLTEERKKRMSEAHKGKGIGDKNPMFGKRHTKESLEKMSRSLTGLMAGEKCPSWKGGITPIAVQVRNLIEYRRWRWQVFYRDEFVCVCCGKGGGIEADHYPKSFAAIFRENKIETPEQARTCEDLWDINNGRTMCIKCHDDSTKTRKQFGQVKPGFVLNTLGGHSD